MTILSYNYFENSEVFALRSRYNLENEFKRLLNLMDLWFQNNYYYNCFSLVGKMIQMNFFWPSQVGNFLNVKKYLIIANTLKDGQHWHRHTKRCMWFIWSCCQFNRWQKACIWVDIFWTFSITAQVLTNSFLGICIYNLELFIMFNCLSWLSLVRLRIILIQGILALLKPQLYAD